MGPFVVSITETRRKVIEIQGAPTDSDVAAAVEKFVANALTEGEAEPSFVAVSRRDCDAASGAFGD